MPQEAGPEMVYKVDEQSLDVGAILILICHDHYLAVTQLADLHGVIIVLLVLKTHDLHNIVDLCILHNLKIRQTCILNVRIISWYISRF